MMHENKTASHVLVHDVRAHSLAGTPGYRFKSWRQGKTKKNSVREAMKIILRGRSLCTTVSWDKPIFIDRPGRRGCDRRCCRCSTLLEIIASRVAFSQSHDHGRADRILKHNDRWGDYAWMSHVTRRNGIWKFVPLLIESFRRGRDGRSVRHDNPTLGGHNAG